MGKGLKIFGGVVVALGAAAYAIPAFFSSDVAAFAKNMANDYVKNCTIDFDDYSLSIFSSFPDLTAGFDDINIIGTDRFEGDTLLHVGSLRVNLDILSAIKGEIVVNGVLIDDVLANAIVTADSIANWDVVADSDDTEEETEEETDDSSTSLQVNLEELAITNVRLSYND